MIRSVAWSLLKNLAMDMNHTQGTVLSNLSFGAGGEVPTDKPMVLSCGGIFIPRKKVPAQTTTLTHIVNLPGRELSCKIFGFIPSAASNATKTSESALEEVLRRRTLN